MGRRPQAAKEGKGGSAARLVSERAPVILPMGGYRKEETEEEGDWVSESISRPDTPSALWGFRGHHLSRRRLSSKVRTAGADSDHGVCARH